MKKYIATVILLGLYLGSPTASASNDSDSTDQNSGKAMPYDLHLSIGHFSVLQSDSSMALKDADINSGIAVSITDALGLDFDHDITRLTLRYRFNPAHGVSLSWFDNESSADWHINNDFVNNANNSANDMSSLSIDINYDITKFSYDWSFYHSEKIEVFTMLGINIMYIGLDYDVDVRQSSLGRKTSGRAPLPAFGLSMNYRVNEYFYWHIKNEIFAINIDDITGSYSNFTVGGEFTVWDHLGLGLAIYNENIDIEEKNPGSILDYSNNFYAFNVYLSAFF